MRLGSGPDAEHLGSYDSMRAAAESHIALVCVDSDIKYFMAIASASKYNCAVVIAIVVAAAAAAPAVTAAAVQQQ